MGRTVTFAPKSLGDRSHQHRAWKAMAPKATQLAFLPSREITADRAVGEWVVRAPKGTRLALPACADRAGTVRTEVEFD